MSSINLDNKLTEERIFLDCDIFLDKIEIVIKSLHTNKAPGREGLISEFYKRFRLVPGAAFG